jgi:4-methylaminobutanoate oxidase (formaldehyde-forming)
MKSSISWDDPRAMIDRADIVVIGSGGLGAATAFYLVQRGARDVVLLEKHELASQTSPRAAGLAAHARSSDLMVEVVRLAAEKLKRFSEDTGRPLAWTQSGSLKVARRPEDVAVLDSEHERGRRLGLDVELISPAAASRLNPFLRTDGVLAVMRIGDDLYFEPSQVAIGFARGAEARGATLMPHTTVSRVEIDHGEVTASRPTGERFAPRSWSMRRGRGRVRSPQRAGSGSRSSRPATSWS